MPMRRRQLAALAAAMLLLSAVANGSDSPPEAYPDSGSSSGSGSDSGLGFGSDSPSDTDHADTVLDDLHMAEEDSDEGGGLAGTVGVVSICSAMMALGTLAMLVVRVPKKIEASTQNFSAGILIAAIAGELFPLLHGGGAHRRSDADGKWEKTLGMLFGFCLGIVLMFGQKALLGHDHADSKLGEEPGIKLSEVKKVLDTPEQSFEDMKTAGMDIPGVDQDIPGVDQVTNTAENDRVAMIKHAEHAESPKSGPRTPRELLRKRADLRREISGKRHLEEGEAGDEEPTRLEKLSERMVSQMNVVAQAVTILDEMQLLSGKVHDIISDGADATSRDELDDELSEMHMYVGVLRRQIRGADPLSENEHRQLRAAMLNIDKALKSLYTYFSTPGVSVDKTDKVLRAIETELQRAITTHIDSVQSFRRWQPVPANHSAKKSEIVPWSLVIGVSIDCLVDGLMVGLTYKASMRAGLIMAFASSIESCFLGLSLSSSVYNITSSRAKHLGISGIPILALQVGGFVAALMGDSLQANEAAFAGFITFAIVALLFLVTQELLLTAHEITDQASLWYVNINLFLGAGMVMFIEQLLA